MQRWGFQNADILTEKQTGLDTRQSLYACVPIHLLTGVHSYGEELQDVWWYAHRDLNLGKNTCVYVCL